MDINDLTYRVIGCAMEVHRHLGPGLLESAYESCLAFELGEAGIPFERQIEAPVRYKSLELDCAYRIDLLVENRLILELKAVDELLPIHEAQLLTYMKLKHVNCGPLINFNVPVLKDGIKRFVI